jgi:hypothetical protein
MITTNEELQDLCCWLWAQDQEEGRDLFKRIDAGVEIWDFLNEGTSASDGLSLIMLGAELQAKEEPHAVVDVDGIFCLVFHGKPDDLVCKANEVCRDFEGGG